MNWYSFDNIEGKLFKIYKFRTVIHPQYFQSLVLKNTVKWQFSLWLIP